MMRNPGGVVPRWLWSLRGLALAGAVLVLAAAPGCLSKGVSPVLKTVPPEWHKKHPWGPEANELRDAGQLPILHYTSQMAAWAAWGRDHLQDGDLLFRYGRTCSLYDFLTSRMISVASASAFSHAAIVHFHNGQAWIIDAEDEGIRDMPFEVWMIDTVKGSLAVKRLLPEYQSHIPGALAYCMNAHLQKVQFDHDLHLDDDKLYCTEMIEKAFRSTGLKLNDPVPLHCFPHYRRYRWLEPIVERTSTLRPEEPVFAVGNPDFGTYGSPRLEIVYEEWRVVWARHRSRPPVCPAASFDDAGTASTSLSEGAAHPAVEVQP